MLGMTIFVLQAKIPFTMLSGIILVILFCLMISGVIIAIFPCDAMQVVYAFIGGVIGTCYVVIDIQLIMDGKYHSPIESEEYVFAALQIYLDIIEIFYKIFSDCKK